MVDDVKVLDEVGLLRLYAEILDEMKEREMIRSANAIPGDLGERFVKRRLGLELAPNSAKGFDAVDANETKYQIKTRRITPQTPSRQLEGFRDLDQRLFDYCIVVILQKDFTPTELWQIPHRVIVKYARDITRGFKRVVFSGAILRESERLSLE
jgi:hypothetical protein